MQAESGLAALSKATDLDSFLIGMAKLEHRGAYGLRIARIELAGKIGTWNEDAYDRATKTYSKQVFQDYTDGSFTLSPLVVSSFCKWKYDEDAREGFETTEFLEMVDNPIKLYRITHAGASSKSTRELIRTYADYQEFKARHSVKDELTGKTKAPYDFFVCLYAYHHGSKRVVKIEMKGSSRAAWFDFRSRLQGYEEIRAMCQAKVRVGKDQGVMKTGEDFFMAKFSFEGANTEKEMVEEIIPATKQLMAFLAAKQNENKVEPAAIQPGLAEEAEAIVHEAHPAIPAVPTEAQVREAAMNLQDALLAGAVKEKDPNNGIRLEDIPF